MDGFRSGIFGTVPLIVNEYAPAAAVLALDWFEEIRQEAAPGGLYVPTPRLNVTDDDISAMLAANTNTLLDVESDITTGFEGLLADAASGIEAGVQKQVASGFWDTTTENANDDPRARGWQRFARPDACKFCKMLASRGAVYRASTARFAAHTTCHCVAGPSYDQNAPLASAEQYLGSKSRRSPAESAALRKYLNKNFPDAPG